MGTSSLPTVSFGICHLASVFIRVLSLLTKYFLPCCRANGVDPKDGELAEFYALAFAAIAAGVILVAHNASFDVGRLNSTALKHKLKLPPLCSAPPAMLCTMNSAAQHCRLRKKGDKGFKRPSNEELYVYLHQRKPSGQLHRALPDCRITLSSFIKGRAKHWW